MDVSVAYPCVSPSLSPSLPLSLQINKRNLSKNKEYQSINNKHKKLLRKKFLQFALDPNYKYCITYLNYFYTKNLLTSFCPPLYSQNLTISYAPQTKSTTVLRLFQATMYYYILNYYNHLQTALSMSFFPVSLIQKLQKSFKNIKWCWEI